MRISPIAALAAVAVTAAALASCSGPGPAALPGSADQQPAVRGPAVTLRVALYGSPGYQQAGLFTAYQRLHPGIRIVADVTGQEPAYWQTLRRHLATGSGLGDLVAIPMAQIGEAVHRYRSSLVPLSTLGGVGGGVNTFEDQWLPWIWQPAYHAGQAYAIGAETGPLALCYRPRLLTEAGLPSSPARLARDWSTWQSYLAFGREFRQRIPRGPAFMDSVTSVYDAMVSQAGPVPAGQAPPASQGAPASQAAPTSQGAPAGPAGDPVVKRAWDSAATAAKDGLSAGLAPQTRAWDTGVARLSFATTVCPPWLLGPIERLSGRHGAGTWAVTTVPGGTGDWGGFYLAVPRASAHQQDAYQLAAYLSGQQAGPALARSGAFPASSPAINASTAVTSSYFSGSATGRIFALAATRMPATGTPDPAATALAPLVGAALAQVQAGALTPARAWSRLLRHTTGG
jgi:cellobiose transport system substrate-binding protein